jgi:putative ATPase
MDLFSHSAKKRRVGQPLAERMRPRELAEVVGQGHLLGEDRLLGRVLADGSDLPSLILWGPPGTGKTTVARLVAGRVGARFEPLSAVTAGVRDIREVVGRAAERRDQFGEPTLLFLDEIHRFSKSQQDALLPHVEAGTVTLVGATTENPSFEVNAPLLSRCRVLRLEPLGEDALRELAERALSDRERGLGSYELTLGPDVLDALVQHAAGDARRLLNSLEVAAHVAHAAGERVVSLATAEEALQQRTLLYDKAGDEHYGVVSAFIKSLRGSDPDAATYWMVRMLEAGEDPLFVLRRMVIFASEDIGNADPQALGVATGALSAFQFIGLPEGVLPMTQAAVYLACAPKSNTALTSYAAARKAVREHGALPVPAKLRNAVTALQKQMGHGRDYKYPHDFEGHYVPESYLPEAIEGSRFYEPSDSGYEATIKARLEALRARRR